MSAVFLGGKTLGAAMPEVDAATALFINGIQPRLAGALAASARISVTPPTLAAQLATAEQLVAAIQAAIVIGLPTVNIQIAALAQLIAELQGQLAAISALQLALGTSIDLWAYTGPAAAVSLEGQVAPNVQPNAPTGAIILTASTPPTRAILGAFFDGAPIT